MAAMYRKIVKFGRRKGAKDDRGSVYSMVSCSDLTPGSVDVWIDLPEEIKHDPELAPFKQLYHQRQHGKLEQEPEGDSTIFTKNNTELAPIGENNEVQNAHGKCAEERFLTHPNDEKEPKSTRKKQMQKGFRIFKLATLVASWIFLTVSLLLHSERNDIVLHTAVKSSEIKAYDLEQGGNNQVKILVTLSGPFRHRSSGIVSSNASSLRLWLHGGLLVGGNEVGFGRNSTFWTIPLQPDDILDFSPSVTLSQILVLEQDAQYSAAEYARTVDTGFGRGSGNDSDTDLENISYPAAEWSNESFTEFDTDATKSREKSVTTLKYKEELQATLRMHTKSEKTVPITVSYLLNPLDQDTGVIYAVVLLCSLYILIIFELVNRTLAALLTSSLAVAVLAIGGSRPTLPELMSWLDVETLLLLFSMMLLVAILAETGLFDYLAVLAFELTGGRTWPLINCLCFFTAIFSTFLDNVTTVLLMTPVTIRLCEVMQLNPIPVLMCMVIFSNVGGAATPVGDPPNVIIATHPSVINEGINFASFSMHMGFGIILVAMQTYLQLRYMFRDMNKLRHSVPQDIIELRQEVLVWRRAAASLSCYSRDEDLVRKALERKVEKLSGQLKRREAGGGSRTDPNFCTTLADMKNKYRIRDKPLLIKSTICVSFVVVVFFLHAIPELQRLSLGWTALLGALLLLVLAEREDLEPILARVEWSTLLFFAALFVLMEALSKLGLIAWVGNLTENIILKVGVESRLFVAILLVLWVSGVVSAFVDNIPLTTMMVRVIAALAEPGGLGLPLAPLAWALSFGACLGGNGTLIGASANVVCAGVAEQHGYRITFLQFIKIGFPIMIGNLIVASAYLMFCHVLLTWH